MSCVKIKNKIFQGQTVYHPTMQIFGPAFNLAGPLSMIYNLITVSNFVADSSCLVEIVNSYSPLLSPLRHDTVHAF